MAPEVLSVEQAQAAGIGLALSDAALEEAILEEEAWLAGQIGPLVGERTQRFPLSGIQITSSEVILQRPTTTDGLQDLTIDGDTILTEVELRPNGWVVARLPEATRYGAVIEATYTPRDELVVRRALKALVSLTLGDQAGGGLQAEIMGSYSYTRAAGSATRIRKSIVRSLQYPARATTVRVLSSVPHGTAGALGR